jgi:hypothetical protein
MVKRSYPYPIATSSDSVEYMLGVSNATLMQFDDSRAVFVGSTPAQGDIIYWNGSAWTLLPAGTADYVLKTGGAGANPSWTSPATVAPRHYVLASEFGAVGDNTADDTAELQAMIDEIAGTAVQGWLVGSTGSSFKISSALVAPTGTILRGHRGLTTIYPTGIMSGIVADDNVATRTYYWDFKDFAIRYPSLGTGGNAFNLQNVSHSNISGCSAIYADVGFWFSEDAYYNHVEYAVIDTCAYGMYTNYVADKGSNQNTFIGAHCLGIPTGGYGVVDYSNQNNWISCSFEGGNTTGTGAIIQSGSIGSTIQGCRFEGLDQGATIAAGAENTVLAWSYFENNDTNVTDGGTNTHWFGQ